MKRNFCLFLLLAIGGYQAAFAQFIEIRLSYKVILNPADGTRPSKSTNEFFTNIVAEMNALMTNYQRGFRFRLAGPIEEVGGMNDTTGPSRYYDTDFNTSDPIANGFRALEIEQAAIHNTSIYKWRNNAINLYINDGTSGGFSSPPDQLVSDHIVLLGRGRGALTHLHEIGHYFFLWHTQGQVCGCGHRGDIGICNSIPGDDFVSDTLTDFSYWSRDELARQSFNNRPYDQLNAIDQEMVDNTYFNLMSYHGNSPCGQGAVNDRLTERQLDRFADAATGVRNYVVTGATRFVDWRNGCAEPAGNSGCNDFGFGGPFRRVQDAITAADSTGGDLVVIRPGDYNEPIRISKRVTLRATRAGTVDIGRP